MYTLLSEEELFIKYEKDKSNKEIRNELVKRYLYIADIIAKKYTGRGIDYDELYQVASLSLIKAVERYDYSKGYAFNTFATPTISGDIKKYFRDLGWSIRIPRRLQELSKHVSKATDVLSQKLERSPTLTEISQYLNIPYGEIVTVYEASFAYNTYTLDELNNSDTEQDYSLHKKMGYNDLHLEKHEYAELLNEALKKLNKIQYEIVKMKYVYEMSQIDISKKLNVTPMFVSRTIKKIEKKLDSFKKDYLL